MPQTLSKTPEGQIIGGTFSDREKANQAAKAFEELGFPRSNIEVIVQLNEPLTKNASTDILSDRGFSDTQAGYYDHAITTGKVLVVLYGVTDPQPVIDTFDKFGAEYNPNGSRNLRDDVTGMTVGAAVGAVTGGAIGAAVGGPLGAAIGVTTGAVVGGGTGAAAGKTVEHRK